MSRVHLASDTCDIYFTYAKVNHLLYTCSLDPFEDGILLDTPLVCMHRYCRNFMYDEEECKCRSNGPRVGQPEPHNLSRHRGRLRPSRPQGEEPPPGESTARRPTARTRPSPRATSREAGYGESARDSDHLLPSPRWTGRGTVTAWPIPLLLTKGWHGYSVSYRWRSPSGAALLPCLP